MIFFYLILYFFERFNRFFNEFYFHSSLCIINFIFSCVNFGFPRWMVWCMVYCLDGGRRVEESLLKISIEPPLIDPCEVLVANNDRVHLAEAVLTPLGTLALNPMQQKYFLTIFLYLNVFSKYLSLLWVTCDLFIYFFGVK